MWAVYIKFVPRGRVAGRVARVLVPGVGRDDDDVLGRAGADGVDQPLHHRLQRRPADAGVDRLVERLVEHVGVAGELRRDVRPERVRVGRRGPRGGVVDLVVIDDDVQVLAGRVVDRRLEDLGDVVGGGERRCRRAARGRARSRPGRGSGEQVGDRRRVVVDLRDRRAAARRAPARPPPRPCPCGS